MAKTMKGFPFDSAMIGYDEEGRPRYDRAIGAAEAALLMSNVMSDGIFGADMFALTVKSAMTFAVGPGRCMIRGRFGWLPEETSLYTNSLVGNRSDTIVLRLNLGTGSRCFEVDCRKGSDATPPAPVRNGTVWELALYHLYFKSPLQTAADVVVTDKRQDAALCGLVRSLLKG